MRLYNYLHEKSGYKLYCDMDGVLVDFIAGADEVATENNYNSGWIDLANKSQKEAWSIINEKGADFWANLEWEMYGKRLWSNIKKYNPIILSAYPYTIEDPTVKTDAIIGKKAWIEKNIGNIAASEAIICSRDEKAMFAESNAILIDDMDKNIKEWQQAGGVGILYKSLPETMKKIEKII